MINLFETRKLAFNQLDEEIIGSNSAIIGHRAQLYDLRRKALNARNIFSFTIQHSRVIDISTCSMYSPLLRQLKDEKLKLWFTEEDPLYTNVTGKFDTILKKAKEMGFIKYDSSSGRINRGFDNPSSLLEKCGSELKTWLKNPASWQTRKITSTDGIVMLDCVNFDKPVYEEIKPEDFGLLKSGYVNLISLLQTFGVVKVIPSNHRIIPYLSFEIYGNVINKGLDDLLENKFNRTIYELCRKMPGISFDKIESMAFEYYSTSEKSLISDAIFKILGKMQESNFIEIFRSKPILKVEGIDNHYYIVPIWLRDSILKIHPSRVESEMINNAIRSCGALWEGINDMSDYSVILDNTLEVLNSLARGESITFKDIMTIDERIKPLLISFHENGIIKQSNTDFSVDTETIDLLKIIVDILKISNEAEIWTEFVKGKPSYENMATDLKTASTDIHDKIVDRYKPQDLKKFSEYK